MPDFDFRKLSDEDLLKICKAGENEAGYKVFQNASALIAVRRSTYPGLSNLQHGKSYVIELTDDQITTLKRVLEIMPN